MTDTIKYLQLKGVQLMEEIKELEKQQEPRIPSAEYNKVQNTIKTLLERIKTEKATKELMQHTNKFFKNTFGMSYKKYVQLDDTIRGKRLECVLLAYSVDVWNKARVFN